MFDNEPLLTLLFILACVIFGIIVGYASARQVPQIVMPTPAPKPTHRRWRADYFMLDTPNHCVSVNMSAVRFFQFRASVDRPGKANLLFRFDSGGGDIDIDMNLATAEKYYTELTGHEPPAYLKAPPPAPVPSEIVTGPAEPQPFPGTYSKTGPLP